MSSKTGRSWLDCKDPQMADHFLRLAVKVIINFTIIIIIVLVHS